MKVHLVDGTYELFRQHFGRAAREPDAGPYAATAGVLRVDAAAARRRRDPRRRGQRPRHRELPQRPVARLQDERRDAARSCSRRSRWSRRRSRRWASRRGRWSSTRPTTRSAPRPPSPTPTSGSSRSLIVTPDKDLGQCVRGHAGRAVRPAQARDHRRGRRRSPSSASPPASIPDYLGARRRLRRRLPRPRRAGAPRAPPPCSPATATSRTSRRRPGSGTCPGLRGAAKLSATLQRQTSSWPLLFRRIATVETDVDVGSRRRLARGPGRPTTFDDWAVAVGEPRLAERAATLAGAPIRASAGRHVAVRPERDDPPAEVTARRSAAHERYR